ncbi:MAG: hypothetical protein ACLSAH_16845 [Bilophila wadsworthia]
MTRRSESGAIHSWSCETTTTAERNRRMTRGGQCALRSADPRWRWARPSKNPRAQGQTGGENHRWHSPPESSWRRRAGKRRDRGPRQESGDRFEAQALRMPRTRKP